MKFILELPDHLGKSAISAAAEALIDVSESRIEAMQECWDNGDAEGAEVLNRTIEKLEYIIDALGSAKGC